MHRYLRLRRWRSRSYHSATHHPTGEENGALRIIRTYVQDYTTIDHGGVRVTAGTLAGVVTILQSSGGPFVEGTHDRATCMVYIKRSEAGYDPDESSGDTS